MPHYENIDFEIPSSWELVTLAEVFFMHAGKAISASDISAEPNGEYRYICVGGNGKRGYVTSFNTEGAHPIIGRQGALCGNINYSDGLFYATEHAVVVDTFCETDTWWAYYFLTQLNLNQYATATAQPGLSVNTIGDVQIPLPPIAEQRRIVETIEQWFSLIDQLENSKEELATTIQQAKSKILDLAIHGKLVPQDPNDEPAIELLKRINPKFEPCNNAHYPFEIPDNWIWAKGMDIFEPMASATPIGDTFKYIDIDAIDNKLNIITAIKRIRTIDAPSRASRYTEKGNVLFSMVRPYLRNIAMITEDDCIASTGFFVCREKKCLLRQFCFYLMLTDYVVDGLNDYMKGDNSPSINKSQIESFLFPIPPYKEQCRIMERIKNIFRILDIINNLLET